MSDYTAAGASRYIQGAPCSEITGLHQKLAKVRLQIACAEDLFNCATDDVMLDSSIYQIKSLQLYYNFLVSELRQEERKLADPLVVHGDEPAVQERVVETMG